MLTKDEIIKKFEIYANLMRLNRPAGLLLLLLPTMFAILIATHHHSNYLLVLKFFFGAILVSRAGCIINDLIDKDIDKKVKRTKGRAITAGLISQKEAIHVLIFLLACALLILLTMSWKTIIVGLFTIIPITLYPYMKRITYFPQVFLGFTFNLGVILAFIETHGALTLTGFLIYLALSLWTMSYDTIYGFLDKEDDLKIGVKSTSIFLAEHSHTYMEFFNTIMILLLVLAGLRIQANFIYFICMGCCLLVFLWQKNRLDINDPKCCELIFNSNLLVGILLIIGALNA